MKRVLFIGHDASRSGGPMVLLHILRWLKAYNTQLEADLLLLRGGPLESDYQKVAKMGILPQPATGKIAAGIERLKRLSDPLKYYYKDYDTVVGNTVATLEHLKMFKQRGARTISWLHELEYAIDVLVGKKRFAELAEYVDEFIVGSKAVEDLLKQFGIRNQTHLAYDFWEPNDSAEENGNSVKEELGIPPDALVVVGCGAMEWRKGIDLFLQIASRVTSKSSDIFFIWVGGNLAASDVGYIQTRYDYKLLDLEGKVFFVGIQQRLHRFFAAMDVFALTSREDPFPLVCLEAASLRKPIVCFENSGGMPEFIEDDAGIVVPYGDILAFADSILRYQHNRPELERAGMKAREKFTTRFSPEISCQRINEILLSK